MLHFNVCWWIWAAWWQLTNLAPTMIFHTPLHPIHNHLQAAPNLEVLMGACLFEMPSACLCLTNLSCTSAGLQQKGLARGGLAFCFYLCSLCFGCLELWAAEGVHICPRTEHWSLTRRVRSSVLWLVVQCPGINICGMDEWLVLSCSRWSNHMVLWFLLF